MLEALEFWYSVLGLALILALALWINYPNRRTK